MAAEPGINESSGGNSSDEGYLVKKLWLGDNLIRPKPWQPNSNTVLYLPLRNDFLDYSGNNVSITNSGSVTIENGTAKFNGSNYLYTKTLPSLNATACTISVWYKDTSTTNSGRAIVHQGWYKSGQYYVCCIGHNETGYVENTYYGGFVGNTNKNEWNNIILVRGNPSKCYINGEEVQSDGATTNRPDLSSWLGIGGGMWYNSTMGEYKFIGNISEVIYENNQWTAEQCKEYFLSTKGRYNRLAPIPKPVIVEESYDFKQIGNATDFANAGWSYKTEANGTFAINSSMGVYSSTDGYVAALKQCDLSSAKKVTITATYYTYLGSWNGACSFGITSSDDSYTTIWNYFQVMNNSGYNYKVLSTKDRELERITYNIPTGEHTYTLEIDLETGGCTMSCDSLYTLSGTLTAAEITDIKTNGGYMKFYTCYNGGTQHQIWNVGWKIEN